MNKWYVVQTQPQQELRASVNLRRQGYEVWMPVYQRLRRHARKVEQVSAPLFSGYIFVFMNPECQTWRSINGTFGVIRLICQDSRPVAVPSGFVEYLQGKMNAEGFIETPPEFHEGQAVRISEGPFEDFTGTLLRLDGHDRALLLLTVLGRDIEASFPQYLLTPAA